MRSVTAYYETRRGASMVTQWDDAPALLSWLKRQKRHVVVRLDGTDEKVGGVEYWTHADDRRGRWVWWLDPEAVDA